MGKNKKHTEVKTEEKKISNTKLLYLVTFLLFAGMILLYSSDTFRSLPKGGAVSNNHTPDPHAGADLSKLNDIKRLEEVMAANPTDHQSLLSLAHLYNDSGFKEKAIESYTKYLAVHPREADVIVDMSVCYYDIQNNEKALELLEEAISIQPNHQIAHFNMGIVHFSAGNIEAAKKYWQDAIRIDPNNEVGKRAEELSKSH